MKSWDLNEIDVDPHQPQVLASEAEGRVIAIHLPKGEQLQEHQVHERAWLVVASGRISVSGPDGEKLQGEPGFLAQFPPNERREVTAEEDSRLLLLLSPWPGEGHPSQSS
jgi:quercetin dioxygenase-like cupin family protein